MAAGKFKLYDLAKKRIGDGTFDLDAALTFKCALFLSTSNCNTLSVGTAILADLTNEHANAFGYTTGGVTVASNTWTNAAGTITFDLADAIWTAAGGSIVARYAVVYALGTLNGVVNPLLGVALLDTTPADVTATDTNPLTVQWNTGGLFTMSGAAVD